MSEASPTKGYFNAAIAAIVATYLCFQLFKPWNQQVTLALRKYPFLEIALGTAIWPFCIACVSISVAACLLPGDMQKKLKLGAKGLAASLLLSVWIGISFSTFMWVFGWFVNQADNVGGGIIALFIAMISASCVFMAPIWVFGKIRK